MKNTSFLFINIFIALLLTACEKTILGTDLNNDPETNFEVFWQDFDQHYALFGVKQIDWVNLYDQYRPQVTATTTDKELWSIMTQMIEHLNDGHTFLLDIPNQVYYESGDSLNKLAIEEFDLNLIYNKYVTEIEDLTGDKEFSYGSIKDKDIGYIYLGGMHSTDPSQIDRIVKDLNKYQAIVFDIRNNGGGSDAFSARIASAFSDGEHFVYTVQNRNGPGHNDFEAPRKYYTSVGEQVFLKPVILLTDRYTASAGEIFGLYMNPFEHVIKMGDNTAGDFSDGSIRRFLPNGWEYRYSIQKFLLPDGRSLEGIGNTPDIYSKNTKADIEAGNDKVLEDALKYLHTEFNIQ